MFATLYGRFVVFVLSRHISTVTHNGETKPIRFLVAIIEEGKVTDGQLVAGWKHTPKCYILHTGP